MRETTHSQAYGLQHHCSGYIWGHWLVGWGGVGEHPFPMPTNVNNIVATHLAMVLHGS